MASRLELLDLPSELLMQIAGNMCNLEDFNNTACTCRRLRVIFGETKPNIILRLAARSAPTFSHPHPHHLVLATARQVANWAVGNPDRTGELMAALRNGMEGFLALCLRVGGITMADIRRLHLARFEVINPLTNLVDTMIGDQWYATENFWNGGVSDAFTLYAEVSTVTYELLIYGELFGPTLQTFLQPGQHDMPRFDIRTRLEYILYCVPDWVHRNGGELLYQGHKVESTGPYALDGPSLSGNQTALLHLLGYEELFSGGRWTRAWERAIGSVKPPADAAVWRKKLWWDAVTQVGGLEGMALLMKASEEGERLPEPEEERLRELWKQIEALDETRDRPGSEVFGERHPTTVSKAPDLAAELYVCCASMWGGV